MNEHELILKIKSMFDGAGFDNLSSAAGKMQSSVMGASKAVGVGMLAAGVAVTAVGASAVSAASEFTAGMSGIQAVTGATTDEMEKVRAKAMQIGADTSFSAMSAAEGMEELLKAGVNLEGVLGGAADAAVALAAAGGTDLATAAEISANAMNMFHMEAAQLPGVADLIAGAANASAISVEDFGYSMSAAGAVAATAGFSFDDMAVAVTAMGNAGIKGSDAGTSLKTMMMNLIPTTKKQYEAFAELGITYTTGGEQIGTTSGEMKKASEVSKELSAATAGMDKASKAAFLTQQFGASAFDETGKKLRSMSELGQMAVNSNHALAQTTAAVYAETQKHNLFIDETTGAMKPMNEIAGVLNEKMKDLSDSERMVALEAMFGSDAIRAAAVMADQGKEGFDGLAKSMGAISAADVAKTRLDNFAGSLEAFKGSVETVQIQLGEKLLPALRQVTDAGSLMVNALGMFVSGDVAGASEKMAEGFASLGMNIDPAKFTEMFTAIQDGMARIQAAFEGAGSGIGEKLVTAIIAVVDVIVFLVENPAVAKMGLIFTGLIAAIAPIAAILAPVISVVGTVVGLFGGWAAIGSTLMAGITGLIAILGGPLTVVIGAVALAIGLWMAKGEEITAWITEWGGRIIDAFKDIFGIASPSKVFTDFGIALIQGLIDGIASLIESVVGILSTLGARMLEKWSEMRENIMAVVEMIRVSISAKWDAIKEYLDAKLQQISAVVSVVWQAIKDKVAEILQGVQDKIGEAWAWILAKIDGVLQDIQSVIGTVWDWIDEKTHSVLNSIQDIFNSAMDWIEQKTGASMDNVKAAFDDAITVVHDIVDGFIAFFKGDWEGMFDAIQRVADNSWTAIKNAFSRGWEDIKKIMNLDSLVDAFGNVKDRMLRIGSDIVAGIQQGISDAWETLKNWLKGKISGLFDLMTGPDGIDSGSPSRRAAREVGVPLGQGIIAGLAAALSATSLVGIVRDWTSSLRPADVAKLISPALSGGMAAALVVASVALGGGGSGLPGSGRGRGGGTVGGRGTGSGSASGISEQWAANARGTGWSGLNPGDMGKDPTAGRVRADAFRSGTGGQLAASKSNYWQVFVAKWGVPTESSARKVARQLGIPLPQWLEDVYNPPGGSTVDSPDPLKDPAPAEEAGKAMAAFSMEVDKATGAISEIPPAIALAVDKLKNAHPGSDPIVRPVPEAPPGGIGGPIVIEPPPGSEVKVDSVEIGAINNGPTTIMLDGKVLARAIVDTLVGDTVVLDRLGKALGKRKAVT